MEVDVLAEVDDQRILRRPFLRFLLRLVVLCRDRTQGDASAPCWRWRYVRRGQGGDSRLCVGLKSQ